MPPRENGLGVPGQAASDAQQLQNVRQRGANAAGQQIYNNPTTAAGMDAQHKWNQNNPIPKQSIDTVYGGVNYGNKLQKDTEVAVDQEQIGRGGPGTGNAMIRAGLLDANGYKHGTPGVNSRDTRSESAQHSQHNSVMADIKREQSNGGIQNSRVNTVNPVNRVDISGDRRREEAKNGWEKGSMDQGGANYAANGKRSAQLVQQNGPTGVPQAPLAAPTPAPVAKPTQPPAPQGGTFAPGQWNGTPGSGDPRLAELRKQNVVRPDGSFNPNAQMDSHQQGPNSPQQSAAISGINDKAKVGTSKGLPGGQQSTAELQASGQMAPRPAGRYGMTDEQWFNTPEGQKQAQGMKATHQKLFGVPDSEGSLNVSEKNAGFVGPDNPLGLPAPDVNFTPKAPPEAPKPMWNDPGAPAGLNSGLPLMRGGENLLGVKPQGVGMPPPPAIKPNPGLAPAPQRTPPRPIAPPSSGLKGSTTPRAPAPKPKEPFTIGNFTQAVDENTPPVGPRPPRVTPPAFKEGMQFKSPVMQQFNTPKPVEGVDKMPTIRKSNPIADTIKASNNPVPVVDTPKPTQQAPAKKKPLFPRLRGRR